MRILLLGPNRWPTDTSDRDAGLQIRRTIVADNDELDVEWIIMEDDTTPGDATKKFLALATDPATTHIFLIWPRDAKMVGTEDELILWQSIRELKGTAPECYLFHRRACCASNAANASSRSSWRTVKARAPISTASWNAASTNKNGSMLTT